MTKQLWLTFVALMLPAWVAAQEMAAADKPPETVDVIYVIIFGVIFLGMIVGFFVYMWLNEQKKDKQQQTDK